MEDRTALDRKRTPHDDNPFSLAKCSGRSISLLLQSALLFLPACKGGTLDSWLTDFAPTSPIKALYWDASQLGLLWSNYTALGHTTLSLVAALKLLSQCL